MAMQKVRETEAMTPVQFEQHIVLRHSEQGEIATLTAIDGIHGADRPTWEKYHDYLHKTGEYEHGH